MSCGVGCRHDSHLASLWLWCRPAARAPIRPLTWEPPYAAGVAQEMAKRPKKKVKKKRKKKWELYDKDFLDEMSKAKIHTEN